MALPLLMKRGVVAMFLILTIVLQGTTSVLAGTTGAIQGTVVDASTNQPIAGAHVTASSPSQSATATTDASGRYTFLSLSPDTYTVSVPAAGTHDAYTLSGITVQADQTLTVNLAQPRKLTQIGSVTSRAASALVKPGTTADVYSINATTQDKASTLGGGGTLNSAWSAISSVPGVFVTPGQNGYIGAGATVSIRGGDYDQIGYELDGIPVNRAFDNYPSASLSSLGQQELQVYTGATPANSEATGLSGYINQVIRTGTAPAYRSLDLAVGTPTYYNRIAFETGGANPSRTFSYYFGAGWYNQNLRYFDQYNGASMQRYNGQPMGACQNNPLDPGGAGYVNTPSNAMSCFGPKGQDYTNGGATPAYVLGSPVSYFQAEQKARDTVLNLHFGIPQKSGAKDDVQLLWDSNLLQNFGYSSTNDLGGPAFFNAALGGTPTYFDTYQAVAPYGTVLPAGFVGNSTQQAVSRYYFPGTSAGRAPGSEIPYNQRDMSPNDQGILKLQYQHNFGTNAFARIYGYTYYSDWLQQGPQSLDANYLGFVSPDYELSAHTRGVSLQLSDQANTQHLLSLQGSYTTSGVLRDNNSFYAFNSKSAVGYLVNGSNPYNGVCYAIDGTPVPGCTFGSTPFATFSEKQAYTNTVPVPAAGVTCGGGPCQYVVESGGPRATYNTVVPKFYSASLTDNWRPTDKLNINLGLRWDRFDFLGSNTVSNARTLFYNAWNMTHPTSQMVDIPNQNVGFQVWQPRLGATFTVDPTTVLRASYGRYVTAPNSAFEQYNYQQPNDISSLRAFGANGLGYTNGHNVRPETSNNYDLSFEHQFPAQFSIKLTPFFRKTQDQIQQFYLDQKTSFVSGLNVGAQTSKGVELEIDKGDFARDGIAGRLSFTYTNSTIKYQPAPNGVSVVTGINQIISNYNAYTSFCASNPKDARCGATVSGNTAAPCYTPATYSATTGAMTAAGAGSACAPGLIANPYWNAPVQPLLDPNASYPTFDLFPAGIGSSYTTFGAPYVATALVQWKKGPFSITPALQFVAGQKYGSPANLPGISPDTCGAALASAAAGDPRYQFGAAGGNGYDITGTCDTSQAIPDIYTGRYHGLGEFTAPSNILLHLQATYDLSKRVTLVGNFANIMNRCFGGSKEYWTYNGACGYGLLNGQSGGISPIGNTYNPGMTLQPFLTVPYGPGFATSPFNMYFEARIKI